MEALIGYGIAGAFIIVAVVWVIVSARREREGLDELRAKVEDKRGAGRKGVDRS